jgi:rubrerythrin
MKTCSKCLLLKTITSFYTAPNKDGLEGQCKDCKSTYIKDKWSKDPLYKALHSKYYIKSLKFSEQERQHVCVTCSYLIKTTTAPNITGNCRQCARKITYH